jgi:hypothetical protein
MTEKMVPLYQAEDVLQIKLRDLLMDSDIHIETKIIHGEVCVNPQKMMEANHYIQMKQKEKNGK